LIYLPINNRSDSANFPAKVNTFLFCSLSVFITDDRTTAAAAAAGDDGTVYLE